MSLKTTIFHQYATRQWRRVDHNALQTADSAEMFTATAGEVSVLTLEHSTLPSGHRVVTLLTNEDLVQVQEQQSIQENFCRKDTVTGKQMKVFS